MGEGGRDSCCGCPGGGCSGQWWVFVYLVTCVWERFAAFQAAHPKSVHDGSTLAGHVLKYVMICVDHVIVGGSCTPPAVPQGLGWWSRGANDVTAVFHPTKPNLAPPPLLCPRAQASPPAQFADVGGAVCVREDPAWSAAGQQPAAEGSGVVQCCFCTLSFHRVAPTQADAKSTSIGSTHFLTPPKLIACCHP